MAAETAVASPAIRPKVVRWFKIYAGFLCLAYLCVAAASIFFFVMDSWKLDLTRAEARLIGYILLGFGLPFFAACLVPFVVRRRPWVWTYNLVVICLGMNGALTLPVSIALLIYWIKPEVKSYYGKT